MEQMKATFTCGAATIHLEGAAKDLQDCLESGAVSKHLMTAAAAVRSDSPYLDDETFERALEHAWEWFALHSDHRMRSVHFFIVSLAFLTAGYVTALRFSQPVSAFAICVAGLAVTMCFRGFDLRIRELIQASEAAIKPLQAQLVRRTGIEAFALFEKVESGKTPFTRYSRVILALHATAALLFLAGAWYSVQPL